MSEIFKTFFQNKRTLLLIIGLGLIFSFLPLKTVEAACDWLNPLTWIECLTEGAVGVGEYIVTIPFRVAVSVFVLSFLLIAFLSGLLYALTVIITNWVIHISLSAGITPGNPLTPEIVGIGWTFTRDFANMFFILILVFIGLATILKLREYEAKKLLPKLIIIALLINFTPVIVGLIVDMGNIVTDFLIRRAGDISVLGFIVDVWTYLLESLVTIWTSVGPIIEVIGVLLGIVIYALVAIVFFLLASWVYFWVMLIFFLRIIELWILMILCPIAFLSYIFPPSRTVKMIFPSILHWDKWWEEFLQWVIVGIPLGFFLYLSNWLMNPANTPAIFADPALQLEGVGAYTVGEYTWEGLGLQFASLITSILVPTVALILLYKGYQIAKEAAPEAAKGITEGVKKVGTMATALGITAVTAGAGAGVAAGMLGTAASKAQKLETFMGEKAGLDLPKSLPFVGGKRFEPLKWAVKPFTAPIRGMETVAAPPLLEYAAKVRKVTIPDEFKNMLPTEQEQFARSRALTAGAKAQYGAKMVDLGTFSKTGDEFQKNMDETIKGLAKDKHYKEEVGKIMKALPNKVTANMMLDVQVDDKKRGEMAKKIETLIEDYAKDGITIDHNGDEAAKIILTRDMKSEEISKIANIKDALKDKSVMRGIQNWKGNQIRAGATKFESEFIEGFMDKIEADMATIRNLPSPKAEIDFTAYIKANTARARYLETSAAQELGFGSMYEMAPDVIKKKYKSIKDILEESEGEEKGKGGGEEERPSYIV